MTSGNFAELYGTSLLPTGLTYQPGSIGEAALDARSTLASLASLATPALALDMTSPQYSLTTKATLSIDSDIYRAHHPLSLLPSPLTPLTGSHPYISPHDRTVQALKRTTRELEEAKEIQGYQRRIAELELQVEKGRAELELQKEKGRAEIEELKAELYNFQLLAHRCEDCHTAFNMRKEDRTVEVRASKNKHVCGPGLGNPACAKLQKAQSSADRRDAQKETPRQASNDYEPHVD